MNELTSSSAHDAEWQRLRPVLDDTLDELDERDREAVLLRFFEARSFADIGGKLRLTENAARMRVERALDRLHALLAKRGVTSTTAALALALSNQSGVAAPAGLGTMVTAAALANGAAAGAGAIIGTKILIFMSTTKILTSMAVVVAALAIGAAFYEVNEVRALRATLTAAEKQGDDLRAQLRRLDAQAKKETTRAQAAEEDNAKLLKAIESSASAQATAVAAANPPIAHDAVQARYNKALELARSGNWEAALPELLWCYDEGMVRVSSFTGVRLSFLLSELAKLAQNYPPALAALEERRDAAQRRMQGNATDVQAARDFSSINHYLGQDAATLKYYDELPATDPRRPGLAGLSVYGILVDAQRYADAVQAQPYDRMLRLFTVTSAGVSERLTNAGLPAAAVASARQSVVESTAQSVEALAGAGDFVHARELANKIRTFDDSAETQATLQRHLVRAGHAELLTGADKP